MHKRVRRGLLEFNTIIVVVHKSVVDNIEISVSKSIVNVDRIFRNGNS